MMNHSLPFFRAAFIAVMAALFVSACTPGVSCDVYRLHRLPPPTGETVAVVAADPRAQSSLEFAGYRTMLEERLANAGYTPAADAGNASLIAEIDYSIHEGAPRIISSWPRCSYRYYYRSGEPFNPQWYGYRCWEPPVVSTVAQYVRELRMDIRSAGEPQSLPLFEGRTKSIGINSRLNEIMPYLVAAMFDNFPGESGQWKTIFIEEDALEASPAAIEVGRPADGACPAYG
ncbi:MAG: DUF4136 domain-containing protein [Parasphingopyxis sp.]|uniref:DUF4136 domain-containing protein n=1 Tax=Parasphingopyxis sp. TaxID=1920299 RepID=UPI003FA09821